MENDNQLNERIKNHLDKVTRSSGLPYNEDSIKLITENWLQKKQMFEEQIKLLDMIEVEDFDKTSNHGALLLTYSGSLITIGNSTLEDRIVEYASIKMRSNVPDIIKMENVKLTDDAAIDKELTLSGGTIKKTSALFKIVVCSQELSLEEQDKRIRQATIYLTNGFVKLNRTLMINFESVPEQFTQRAIIKLIAQKNNLTLTQTKQILEDYQQILESGMLLGERVPLGKIGKLFLKLKPAQKARVGHNPATGKEITIDAKPEHYAPKLNFSKKTRQKAMSVKIKKEDVHE